MYKPLHFSLPNQFYNLHFVSCLHLGHDREFLWKPRGFGNVHEHDRVMEERWKEHIRKEDIVFSLGDNIFGQNADKRLEEWIRKVPFWKFYVSPGNHYSGWHQLYERTKAQYLESKGLDPKEFEGDIYPLKWDVSAEKTVYWMPNLYEIYVGKQAAVLCHYPIYPHNGAGKGVWGIFGHCHSNNPATNPKTATAKTLDVCIESFGRPVSYGEIEKWMTAKEADDVVHHKKDTAYAI